MAKRRFFGEFTHQLDPQCRVAMPGDWRDKDSVDEYILAPAKGRYLVLVPAEMAEEYFERMENASMTNPGIQKALADFGRLCKKCRCDKQGRLPLDRERLASVGIAGQITLTGAITHVKLSAPGAEGDATGIEEAIDTLDALNDRLNGSIDNAVKKIVKGNE